MAKRVSSPSRHSSSSWEGKVRWSSDTQPRKDTLLSLVAVCHFCLSNKVHEDGSFYFQVLLRSMEAGTMETVDHFLSVCEMMANVYKFGQE